MKTVQQVDTPSLTVQQTSRNAEVLGTNGIEILSEFLHQQTNLAAAYDARFINGIDGIQPTSESSISQWNDLSGNGKHLTQGNSAFRPLFMSSRRNLVTPNQATLMTDTTGLVGHTNCTAGRSTSQFNYGQASLSLTSTVATSIRGGMADGVSGAPAVAGNTYTAILHSRAATSARTAYVRLKFFDSGGSQVGSDNNGINAANSTSAWTKYTSTAVAPANTAYATASLVVLNCGSIGEVHYADSIGIFEGTTTTWAPTVILLSENPAVVFDGYDDYIGSTTLPVMANSTIYSIAYVLGFSPTINTRITAIYGGAGNHHHFVSSTGQSAALGGDRYHTGPIEFPGQMLMSSTYDNATFSAWSKGSPMGSSPQPGTGALGSGLTLGAAGSGSYSHSAITAVYIYSEIHSTAVRQATERALGQLYGITVA